MPQTLSLKATKRGFIASTPSQISLRLSMHGSRSLRIEHFPSFDASRLAAAAAPCVPRDTRHDATRLDSQQRLLVKCAMVRDAARAEHKRVNQDASRWKRLMLMPMADVPRWFAERKPRDTIAVSHGSEAITWDQLERNANRRARAFAAKGVKPGDFVAIGLPNSNMFFETTFAVWKCGATPTSLTWRLPPGEAAGVLDILKPSPVGGGRADWNAPNSLPIEFAPEGVSDEPLENPVARYWKAMTSGGSTGRPKVILDHQPAVTDPAAVPPLGQPAGASLLNPGPLYHNAPFIVSHTALFYGGRVTGMVKFDAEETL